MNWNDRSILITGGTGSFGRKCVEILLRDYHPRKVIVFSRDELKQHEMMVGGFNHPELRFFLGDVRDVSRLKRAMSGVDIVIHAAALKQVPACEYNPIEAILTNVMGARNVIEAALETGVHQVMTLSSDKAVNPINLYGATKLCAEKLVVQSNAYSGDKPTHFSCVRYGNVVGSRGSVIPLFLKQKEKLTLTVTDRRMTRFWLTLDHGVRFVLRCIEQMRGGEVFVPKVRSMNIMKLVEAIGQGCRVEFIGIRPGEKLHEVLISEDEARNTLEFDDMFLIQPLHPWWTEEHWKGGRPLPDGFRYSSDSVTDTMSAEDLRAAIESLG